VEIRGLIEIAELELGNGFAVAISPEPGLTGESEGAVSRTGLAKVQQRIEAAGRELRSRNGGLETGSRFGGAKGRCENAGSSRVECQAISKALIRRSQKGRRGAEELPPIIRLQSSEPCMPASGSG